MSVSNLDDELKDPGKWSTEDEIYLLYCTLDNEPVGIDKHFYMSIIWSRFQALTKKNISSDTLWRKLEKWYNLKKLDEMEPLPFKNEEEDFLLPAEIIPESYTKFLSEEEKKNIDSSGQLKKFIAVSEPDEEDLECKSKLRGSERMKWFECPSYYKTVEKPAKMKVDFKTKFDSNESSNDSSSEFKPLRKYGKATDITSGSMLTISVPPQLLDELDEGDDDNEKDDNPSSKPAAAETKEDTEKSKKRKRGSSKKDQSDDCESPATRYARSSKHPVETTLTPSARLRKSSVASHEASSGTETEKESSTTEDNLRARRRCSSRVSISESKPETMKLESVSKTPDVKRKSTARR